VSGCHSPTCDRSARPRANGALACAPPHLTTRRSGLQFVSTVGKPTQGFVWYKDFHAGLALQPPFQRSPRLVRRGDLDYVPYAGAQALTDVRCGIRLSADRTL